MTQLIIVDDHPLYRNAAAAALVPIYGETSVLQVGLFGELEDRLRQDSNIDLALLDIDLPDVFGLFGLLRLRAAYPGIPVAIISGHDDPRLIHRAFECGASGYIPKTQSIETLREAVASVLGGQIWQPPLSEIADGASSTDDGLAQRFTRLTAQQLRVLGLLCDGLLNRQMAEALGITEATTKAHVSEILNKLGAHSRTQAVIYANQLKSC